MEVIKELMTFITDNLAVVLLGTVTIVEVTPIKINPWRWFGNLINGGLIEKINRLEEEIATIKKDQAEDNAESMRCRILSFARSCRRHEIHDTEEWNNIISQIKKYETYVKERKIDNGVIEENSAYLRELYHERLKNDDFEQEEDVS